MLKSKKILGVLVVGFFLFTFVPDMIFASSYDDLVKTKEYTIKSVEPENEDFVFLLSDLLYEEMILEYDGWRFDFSRCNENYTSCKLIKYDASQNMEYVSDFEVKINYVYDKDIKKVVDGLNNKLEKDEYYLTDIEYFNWRIGYLTQEDESVGKESYYEIDEPSMVMFSSEFKQNIGYKNFFVDLRLGDDFPLYTARGGSGVFTYDDTIYYIASTPIIAKYNHIFYIDDDELDISKAIKERLELNTTHKFEVEDMGKTVRELLIDEFKTWFEFNNYDQQYQNEDDYAQAKLNELINDPDNDYHYLSDYLDEHVYVIMYDFENVEGIDYVIPVKDSSKMATVQFKSNDVGSDISISTDSLIPLDTLIKVAKLTDGEEYDKIVKLLNMTNIEMFDLKLFSKSANDYITKLDNGTFEVRIPLKDELKDKELVVYYVDDNDNVIEYEVTVENGYAKFNTDHFSIYTLAVVDSTDALEENPQTFDGIKTDVIVGIISLIGFIGAIIYFKRRKNIKNY